MDSLDIYFTRLAVRLGARRYRRPKEGSCDVCNEKFVNVEEMEKHRRDIHPDMSPREVGR